MSARIFVFLRRFAQDEGGAALVEFALVVTLFIFLFFTLIDFGRLGGSIAMAEKAAQLGVRTAVVRPPACPGVPERHVRGTASTVPLPRFGTSCRAGSGVCSVEATVSCAGDASNPTAVEVWTRVAALLPPDATIADLRFEYRYDPNLGFLGGPYTPVVTVEITPPDFQFTSPLGALATALGAAGSEDLDADRPYRAFSVSLPAEDLANGDQG